MDKIVRWSFRGENHPYFMAQRLSFKADMQLKAQCALYISLCLLWSHTCRYINNFNGRYNERNSISTIRWIVFPRIPWSFAEFMTLVRNEGLYPTLQIQARVVSSVNLQHLKAWENQYYPKMDAVFDGLISTYVLHIHTYTRKYRFLWDNRQTIYINTDTHIHMRIHKCIHISNHPFIYT